MEKDRGERNRKSGKKEENIAPALRWYAEEHPDEPDPIMSFGKRLVKHHPNDPYINEIVLRYEEVMNRRRIRESSDQHTSLRMGPKIVERALKHGKEIILDRLGRLREIVQFKPR